VVLSPEAPASPLVVIANYLLDSIPQDAFYLQNGQLYERRVTVSTGRVEADLDEPSIVSRAQVEYSHHPVTSEYYTQPAWNQILETYRQRLPDCSFVMPTAALQGLHTLQQLSDGRMLLLAADKAYTQPEQFPRGSEAPNMVLHARQCFSMMVNFDAIGQYVVSQGGQALLPSRDMQSLSVSAFMLAIDDVQAAAVRRAFTESVGDFGPDDFYTLMGAVQGNWAALRPEQIFAYLRLARGDDWILSACLPVLSEQVPRMTESQRQELHGLVRDVWDNYLPIGDGGDRGFELGTLLYELSFYEDALAMFQHSLGVHGPQSGTLYNIGACYAALRQPARAVTALRESLQLDPNFDIARALLLTTEAEVERGSAATRRGSAHVG
jgi:hypothetical protein